MSEWDYIPSPYENTVYEEHDEIIKVIMSLTCLICGKKLSPIEILGLWIDNDSFNFFLDELEQKTSLKEVLRTMLQWDDLRSYRKRDKVIELLK